MYEGACPPLESNMLLQRKALTTEIYMPEQCAVYIKNLSVTQKKTKLSCCNRCHPQLRIKVVTLSAGYQGLWGGGDR